MSIGNYLTALDEQRDALARNLVTMGVQASETEKLNTPVPKVLQIPQTKPDVTLFRASIDTLHDYGESVYTFYNDGYRSLAGFTESYPHFCCEENGYAIYYNQPDFNWGQTIYTMCVEPVHISPSNKIMIPCEDHHAVQIRKSDYAAYDYIIAMEQFNLRNMRSVIGSDPDQKVYRMLDFTGTPRDVSDPWFSGDFESAYNDISRGCAAFLDYLEGRGLL